MKSCPSCGKDNRDHSRFCNSCGWRLDFVSHCHTCGYVNAGGSAFCNECGAPLAEATSVPPPIANPPVRIQTIADVHTTAPTNGSSPILTTPQPPVSSLPNIVAPTFNSPEPEVSTEEPEAGPVADVVADEAPPASIEQSDASVDWDDGAASLDTGSLDSASLDSDAPDVAPATAPEVVLAAASDVVPTPELDTVPAATPDEPTDSLVEAPLAAEISVATETPEVTAPPTAPVDGAAAAGTGTAEPIFPSTLLDEPSPFTFDWSAIADLESAVSAGADDVPAATVSDDSQAVPPAATATESPDARITRPKTLAAALPDASWLDVAATAASDSPTVDRMSEPAVETVEEEPEDEPDDPTAGIRIAQSLSGGRPAIRPLPVITASVGEGAAFAAVLATPIGPVGRSPRRFIVPQWVMLTILIIVLAFAIALALRSGMIDGLALIDAPALTSSAAGHLASINQALA